jgi:hypothetical protein
VQAVNSSHIAKWRRAWHGFICKRLPVANGCRCIVNRKIFIMQQDRKSTFKNEQSFNSNNSPNSSNSAGNRFVGGMFDDRDSTERAYQALSERGYSTNDIDLMMSDKTRKKYFDKNDEHQTELGNKAMEGAGKGSAIGGTVGAIAGVIAALGTSLVIPGLGLVIAGPIAAGLAGAGAGGLTGGIIGALVGRGIPEHRAKEFESGIKDGKIVMGVTPRNDEDARYFENVWNGSGTERTETYNSTR